MDETKRDLLKAWLVKAQHDLAAARKLSAEPDSYLDTAIYHCQQAAEKAIKAFLVFHDQRFEKTHDLEVLIGLAQKYETKFSTFLNAAVLLTPYAAAFRYPGDILDPTQEQFDEALSAADSVWQFVLSVLPAEVHP
ncbi:MAG: HEPN domain-containing protein [bacterium]